jgi:hypothetical protein
VSAGFLFVNDGDYLSRLFLPHTLRDHAKLGERLDHGVAAGRQALNDLGDKRLISMIAQENFAIAIRVHVATSFLCSGKSEHRSPDVAQQLNQELKLIVPVINQY